MSMRPRVWVTQPVFGDILARLESHFDVRVEADVAPRAADALRAGLHDVDGALVFIPDRIDAAVIAGAHRLRAIANVGVGYDNLDIPALTAAGIIATNTPDVLTETTADFAWALLLATARRVTEAERWLREGQWTTWSFELMLGRDVHGSTLGILGMGRIGQAIARRARGFGMRVLYHNRARLAPELERDCAATHVARNELLAHSDHLVLALPYSAQTHHAIGAPELARMKPGATLVNVARGGIVDDAALADALDAGRIAAAGLDVYENEPAVHPRLLACRNVVLTPHIASASEATRRAMVALAVDNLVAALGAGPHAGRPPNPVNADALLARGGHSA
ncbi:MAG: 2-hydroxyacid dehydrogenase [Dokdonella sp.]|uniref:2-hydroxyacid dehydrogenase n=1 Tax=Dokdonella sp. TaxID=2291710 RepID=UPI003F7FEBF4